MVGIVPWLLTLCDLEPWFPYLQNEGPKSSLHGGDEMKGDDACQVICHQQLISVCSH